MSDDDDSALFNGKIAAAVVLGFATLAASAIPWILPRCFTSRAVDALNVLIACAAGVIFGAYLCHLSVDATEAFDTYFRDAGFDPDSKLVDFPFAGMLAGGVFVLLVGVDRLLVSSGIDGKGSHAHSGDSDVDRIAHSGGDSHNHVADSMRDLERRHLLSTKQGGSYNSSGSAEEDRLEKLPRAHDARMLAQAYVFFCALSIHAVFDGLSIGSELDSAGFAGTLVAVAAHKVFDGIAIGAPVYLSGMPMLHAVVIVVTTAAMTPLGIGIAMGVITQVNGSAAQLAKGILQGLSGGSFIFISLFEMLPASLADGRLTALKVALFAVGWAGMVLLAIVT